LKSTAVERYNELTQITWNIVYRIIMLRLGLPISNEISHLRTGTFFMSPHFLNIYSLIALMMEAARTSVTLVNFYQTTRRYNPEDSHLRTHRRENLKYIPLFMDP
jgi:hypothetical protein